MRYDFCFFAIFAGLGLDSVGSAAAQGLRLTFGATGRLAGGYTDQFRGADAFLFGDATSRVGLGSTPLAFELGIFGLAKAKDHPHETYGTLTWDFKRGGRLSVGVPRPAYDSFAISAVDDMFPAVAVSKAGMSRSLATYGAMFEGYLPYGIRYEGNASALRYAGSIDLTPNRDITIASFGFAIPVGEVNVEGAFEVAVGTTTRAAGKLAVAGDLGGVHAALGFYVPGTVGGPEVLEAAASFDPFDRLTVSGVMQLPLSGSDHITVGVSARYAISPAVGLSAGVLADAASETGYSLSLDWKF